VGDRGSRGLDAAIYAVCAVFAVATAIFSEFYGYRVWGNFASAAYVFGLGHTVWLMVSRSGAGGRLRSRWLPVGAVGLVGMVIPLGVLVFRRLTGTDWLITPWSWAAQPEVWVIERSAHLLFATGTPYVDIATLGRAVEVNDYTPYGPVMAVFGMPRELLGGALTDARIVFAVTTVVTIALSLKLLAWPKVPVRAAHLAIVSPLTALTFAVAGPDLAIIGLIVLAGALAARGRTIWCAVALAVVVSMKLSALPAVVVIVFFVVTTRAGRAPLIRFFAAIIGVVAALNIPVLIVHPGAFVEHVIKFPAGLGQITSPAASPLPGHLIASIGPAGHVLALVLLGLAAVAVTVWLFARPPATGSDAMLKAAIGLGAALLLVPASRYGYLVYPLVLWGAALTFAVAERATPTATTRDPAAGPLITPVR
jgi:Glycosyltransferase family 87